MIGKTFIYDNVRLDDERSTIFFDYQLVTDEKTYKLTETLTLPYALPNNSTIDRILRALHLALGISYYKAFVPPVIDHAYSMDDREAKFWNSVFKNGLGEFLYNNGLKSEVIARFVAQDGSVSPDDTDDIEWQETAVLGIGGGKDSIVAGELLKELNIPYSGFVLATGNNKGQAQAVADTMDVTLLGVERRLDSQILDINKLPGALNGHVPISLVFALVGCLVACCEASRYVIVANESSASISDLEYEGASVNHQWSKSLEFEKMFQEFVHHSISKKLDYFSLIRPLTSVAVAKIFSKYLEYLEVFTSDNSLLRISSREREHPRWSKDSPKSLSSYILLAPWLEDNRLANAFGHKFLDDMTLEELFLDLLGAGDKPVLDCVGTPGELRLSLSMLSHQGRFENSGLVKIAKSKNLIMQSFELPLADLLTASTDHVIPNTISHNLIPILKARLK